MICCCSSLMDKSKTCHHHLHLYVAIFLVCIYASWKPLPELTEHFIAMFSEQMTQGKELSLFFFFPHKLNLRFYVDHILCCVPQVSKPNMTETQTTKDNPEKRFLWVCLFCLTPPLLSLTDSCLVTEICTFMFHFLEFTNTERGLTMRAVITLWKFLIKLQSIILITSSSDKLPWCATDLISPWQWVQIGI